MRKRSEKKSLHQQAAEAWGIDLSLLEANLERTPTERLMVHQSMLETAFLLQQAMKHAQSTQSSSKNPL